MKLQEIGLIAGVVAALATALYYFNEYYQQSNANNAAAQQDANNNDAQLAAMLLQQPLSNSSGSYSQTQVTGPSVDTGNESLQTLIASILQPPSNTIAEQSGESNTTQASNKTSTNVASINVPKPIINGPVIGQDSVDSLIAAKTLSQVVQ
jgi:hypothetical protein